MNNTTKFYVGVDPGWKNMGVCILSRDESGTIEIFHTEVMDPSSFSSIPKFMEYFDSVINGNLHRIDRVTIERFVAYAGVSTSETENICMLIGSLVYYFGSSLIWNIESTLVRAIDWKTSLVKELFKQKQFENPSTKLDKKFSLAAAEACLSKPYKFKTDHEADAACLAASPIYINKGK